MIQCENTLIQSEYIEYLHTGKVYVALPVLRILPVLHMPILWNEMAVKISLNSGCGRYFNLFFCVLKLHSKTCSMPNGL